MRPFFKILILFIFLNIIALYIVINRSGIIKCKVLVSMVFNKYEKEVYNLNNTRIEIWSQVNDEMPTPVSKTVEYGDNVKLFAVVRLNGKIYSDNQKAVASGIHRPFSELNKKISFKWYKLEAQYFFYSTEAGFDQTFHRNKRKRHIARKFFDKFKIDHIFYHESHFGGRKSSVIPDLKSITNKDLKWQGKNVGTMRFKVMAEIDGQQVSSYGRRYLNTGELEKMNQVHRISRKASTESEALNMGFAMGNLPYYYGSYSSKLAYYGSDCAKMACTAHLLAGDKTVGYVTTFVLVNRPHKAILNGKQKDGIYTYDGEPIAYGKDVMPGDIIVISPKPYHHAGLIGPDRNSNGYLDDSDRVLHTSMKAPEYVSLKRTIFDTPAKNLKILK